MSATPGRPAQRGAPTEGGRAAPGAAAAAPATAAAAGPSLLRHLLAWVLGALLLVWLSFVLIGYRTGAHEAAELTDGHLASVAALLLSQRGGEFVSAPTPASHAASAAVDLKDHDYQQSLSIVVWDGQGRVLSRTGEAPLPAFDAEEGFVDLMLGTPPAPWRGFSRWDGAEHQRKLMVLLSGAERDALTDDIAGQIAEPALWLLPVIALVLGLAIRRGLAPLDALSRDVLALDVHQDLTLRNAHPRLEFRAVVDSINTLLARQQAALAREREVASEIAHELRTPLASLALHARSLQGTLPEPQRAAALARLEHDTLRAGHVLDQLLALARASRTELAEAAVPLDVTELAQRVVADYAEPALASGHELALVAPAPLAVRGHAVLLELALRNLIENALAHTPRGSTVEVQVDGAARWLQVCDNGIRRHGAPLAGKAVAGLGLGHRVVDKIARVHGARFVAGAPAPDGFDACYRIAFA